MNKISIALATLNEEKNIRKCLSSVDWADEIIVVDGNSLDNTVEIAKQMRAKVIKTSNKQNFHINKQMAIDKCQSEWILQLDADEVVSPDLKKEILMTIKHKPKNLNQKPVNGYWLPRKNYFLGRWLSKGGQYPDYTLRLYRKGKGRLPCRSVHEQAQVTGKTEKLVNPLLHYPYPDFKHYLEHFDKYTSIFAGEMLKDNLPVNPGNVISYFLYKPMSWFAMTYFRHKGFVDGFQGYLFSLFSSLRFPVSFIKYVKLRHK